MPFAGLGHRLRQDVADVLVRLDAVVERHTGDRFGYGCPSSRFLDASGIQHLLLLKQELLLLLLEHSFLEHLMQLELYLFR